MYLISMYMIGGAHSLRYKQKCGSPSMSLPGQQISIVIGVATVQK